MINSVILQGRMVKEASITNVGGANKADFTLCVNSSYRRKDGTTTTRTEFIPCSCWRGLADMIGQYGAKGKEVIVRGSVRMDNWEKDGKKYSKLYVDVQEISFTSGSKPASGAPTTTPAATTPAATTPAATTPAVAAPTVPAPTTPVHAPTGQNLADLEFDDFEEDFALFPNSEPNFEP